MRLSFDGLYALTRHTMGEDPMTGALFVFINRRARQTKVLYWERTGFCIRAKRLEESRLLGVAMPINLEGLPQQSFGYPDYPTRLYASTALSRSGKR